jgi:hypothetical protein
MPRTQRNGRLLRHIVMIRRSVGTRLAATTSSGYVGIPGAAKWLRAHATSARSWIRLLAVCAVAMVVASLIIPLLTPEPFENSASGMRTRLEELIDADLDQDHGAYAETVVTLLALDPDNRVAKASVHTWLRSRKALDAPTFRGPDGQSVTDMNSSIKPSYAGLTVDLRIDFSLSQEVHVPFRLSELIRPDGAETTADIPANTSSTNFPQDVWAFQGSATMSLPNGISVSAPGAPAARRFDMPLALGFCRDDRLQQWQLESQPARSAWPNYGPGSAAFSEITVVHALLGRPVSFWLFVYVLGVTPLILGCAYIVGRRSGAANESIAALSLAATLLSLLAIRQVVTPAEIHGITRLDHLLGLQLVCLIAVFAWITTSVQATDDDSAAALPQSPTGKTSI